MKRLTTNTPKDNYEAALNLFYIKDQWAWVRGGGPAPDYPDVSLCDYIRLIAKAHIPDAELPEDDQDLSYLMADMLLYEPETVEGLIATLYAAGWAYSELREKLMQYEDTGLSPEECKRLRDSAFGICKDCVSWSDVGPRCMDEQSSFYEKKIKTDNYCRFFEPRIEPITLDELRQMGGDPVWIDDYVEDSYGWELSVDASDYFEGRDPEKYGSAWIAYRRKPWPDKYV